MRIFFIFISIIELLMSCADAPRRKIFVKSVEVSKNIRIDWYVYSSISNFSPDYLQISTREEKPFFTSFYLSDIHFRNDSLFVSLWGKDYELDKLRFKEITVSVDTLGKQWNDASSRIGRLQRRQVNLSEPHFVDTYCPNGECE